MSEPESPAANESNEYGDFPPGTIVLAKLKSFPPWPAIVIPNDLVPENILKSKPKRPSGSSGRGSKRPKRKAAPVSSRDSGEFQVWCVRFLKDDTFMWGSTKELKLLTTDEIQLTLDAWKSTKTKQLKSAYEMALSPPAVEDFIIWGSDGKPIQIDNEADDEDFQIDQDEDEVEDDDEVPEEEEEDNLEEDLEDQDNEESPQPKVNTKKRASRVTPKTTPKKLKVTPKKTTKKSTTTPKRAAKKRGSSKPTTVLNDDPETSGDEDWEEAVDEFEEPEIFEREVPTSAEYTDLLKKNKTLVNKVVIQFTTAFLEEEKLNITTEDLKSLNGLLDQLTKVEDTIPKSLVVKNNVHKLFISILQRNDLKTKNIVNIRTRLQAFLKYWFDLTVEVNPNWKLEPEEEEDDEEEGVEITEMKEETSDVKTSEIKKDEDLGGNE